MKIEDRIKVFGQLGAVLRKITKDEIEALALMARNENNWFTQPNIQIALIGIGSYLDEYILAEFTSKYAPTISSKTVGIVMAGNIPFVGFHDLLCVLLSGHKAMIKYSSSDSVLMEFIVRKLEHLSPAISDYIQVVDKLEYMDAIIATGSDNTARYFEYYFGKYPHIIRKNRTSIGVIKGNESRESLNKLGKDIFYYFGLGCRNVSKIYVPANYDFTQFFESMESYSSVKDHHKYTNNYDYNKSIYLVNGDSHLDNGFLLIKKDTALVSPISVLFYEEYSNEEQLKMMIEKSQNKIQCMVSESSWWPGSVGFGKAQFPNIDDFADQIDTMAFLSDL